MVGILQVKKPSNIAENGGWKIRTGYPGPDIHFCHTWSRGKSGCRAPGSAVRNFQPLFSAVLDGFFTCSTPTIMYDISKKSENWVDFDYVKSERLGVLNCTWSPKISEFIFSTSLFHNVLYTVRFLKMRRIQRY